MCAKTENHFCIINVCRTYIKVCSRHRPFFFCLGKTCSSGSHWMLLAPAMPYTGFKNEAGFLAYYETCLMLKCENWEEHWNKEQKVPYAKGKYNQPWAGYDNVKSMKIKADFIVSEGLAGAMFWVIYLSCRHFGNRVFWICWQIYKGYWLGWFHWKILLPRTLPIDQNSQ